jgi:hypothetical protein
VSAKKMTRSKTQVIYNHLPGAVYTHPSGMIVKTAHLRERSSEVNPELLLENLADQLEGWKPGGRVRAAGFPDPRRHREKYALLEPDGEVYYDVWPLVLQCRNVNCGKVVEFRSASDWKAASNPQFCDKCGSRRDQMEYMMAHSCGKEAPIAIWPCDTHGMEHVYLEDTGSFETSVWRCRSGNCRGRVVGRMRYRPCSCGEPGPFVSLTVRQSNRFLTQTFPFVSFDRGALSKLRDQPGSDKVVVGSYLGLFNDYERALEDVRKGGGGDPAAWKIMEEALRNAGQSEEEIAEHRKLYMGVASEAFTQLGQLVPEDVIAGVGTGQKARERTLIYGGAGGLRIRRLEDFRKAATQGGRQGSVQIVDAAEEKLRHYGFSDAFVIENFPVALVAYGFTRLSSHPSDALLKPFPAAKRHSGKTPIYATNSKTEAIFFELDARRVIDWLVANGMMARPQLATGVDELVAAKAAMLLAYHGSAEVAQHVNVLQHTLAHALIRNLGERSGFGEGTMAEYLIPSLLTFGVYANVHQEFTLGALVSLMEHRLGDWLDATRDGAQRCPWDPVCEEHEGACGSCLHLAFGCPERNQGLDRAMLYGSAAGHEPVVSKGFWENV